MSPELARVRPVGFLLLALLAGLERRPSAPGPSLKVAVHPLQLPDAYEDLQGARATFESIITDELQKRGLTVISARNCETLWERRVDSVGGFYSAFTGELDTAKYVAVVMGTLRDLRATYMADAWLRSYVQIVTAPWNDGKAKWDGVEEGVGGEGGNGTVGALTFVVFMVDADGRLLFTGRGGIQVLNKLHVKFGWNRHPQFKDVPRDKLFRDDGRNRKAVRLALDSLDTALLRVNVGR